MLVYDNDCYSALSYTVHTAAYYAIFYIRTPDKNHYFCNDHSTATNQCIVLRTTYKRLLMHVCASAS